MNYIPAEKLIAEIKRQQRKLIVLSCTGQADIRRDCALQNEAYEHILSFIASLQQEQQDGLADEWDGHTEKDVIERLMKCNTQK